MRRRVLGMILAGGRGKRLQPLTLHRSKPAVPFGGSFRIVDFVLSNFANSGIKSIYILTQFKSQSLNEHLHRAWAGTNLRPGNFIIPVPAQMQTAGAVWYEGTANAIYQNLNLVRETVPDLVCVFGGDHIYFMDVSEMLREHLRREAAVTIAAIPVPRAEAPRLGVIEAEGSGRVRGFFEKVAEPPTMPGDPDRCYASMGNYVFDREVLIEVLEEDAADPTSTHDFGGDILPRMVKAGRAVYAYDFETNQLPGREKAPNTYWRDVGTLDAYYDANLDLKEAVPQLDLYNPDWPINTAGTDAAPAKFAQDADGQSGEAVQSVLGAGTIVSGGRISNSVLGRNVRVLGGAEIEESVINDGVTVGQACRVRRAIVDKDVTLPAETTVGWDAAADRDRGWWVTETGITVVPKSPVIRAVTTLDL
jgi:glucose-1-phosphate adenylyltransferase